MKKCINCIWEGEEAVGPLSHCPACGDNTKDVGGDEKLDFDLNKDGVVDGKDRKIAAKVLGSKRGRKKR